MTFSTRRWTEEATGCLTSTSAASHARPRGRSRTSRTDHYNVSEGPHNYVINTWLIPDGYTCYKRYSVTYNATTQQCIDDINGGISQLTYSGHGSTNGWADGPPMNASQVNALTNDDMLPLVQSYACITGDFALECFGETWTLAPYGSMAFYGSSANSYWTEDDILEKGVYDAWFGDEYRWTRGFLNQGMWDVYVAYSGGGATRRYYEMYNLFGDPALDVWTDPYGEFDVTFGDAFPVGGSTFSIDVGTLTRDPVESALVCIYMDGEFYETAYTDAAGHADITISTPPMSVGVMEVWVSKHNFKPYSGAAQVIVPVTYDIDPPSVPISVSSDVTVTVWDDEGYPKPDVTITIDGWSIMPVVDTTDGSGEAHFTVLPQYGEDLTVVGREIGTNYDAFSDILPVTGGTSFASADIEGNVPAIGLYGMLAPHYEGTITGEASTAGFTLFATGCGVDASTVAGGTSVDLLVTPSETGTINAAIGKKGFNIYLEDITVATVYGQMAGAVYEASRLPIVDAKIKGYPAGADTTGATPLFETVSGAFGLYEIEGDLEVGYYDVYVSKFGYLPYFEEVFIQYGANDVDFFMEFAPAGVVSGTVTQVGTGTPLDATIKIYRSDNMELYHETTSSAAAGGYYEATLPYFNYEMKVRAWHHIPQTRGVAVSAPAQTEDFVLEETLANILLLDDTTGAREAVKIDKSGNVIDVATDGGTDRPKSVTELQTDIVALGYDVVVESAASSDPGTWLDYDLIMSASGDNTSPVANSTYRTSLESFVTAGGKIIVEGGEVGYDAASYPGYPTFAAIVLHITGWNHDSSGTLQVEDPAHAVASFPNTIGPITFTYSGYGDQDANDPSPDAHVVCDWSSYPGDSGVQVYDDNPDPASGQIVFFQFNYAAAAAGRMDLLENAIVYLTTPESTPTGGIDGHVTLSGQANHSGVLVTASPGGASAYTDASGHYSLEALYAGSYTVTATMDDWSTGVETPVAVAEGEITYGVNFTLFPQTSSEICESPGISIPDNNPGGVYDTMVFTEDLPMDEVEVYVNITHTFIGDLIVELTSPEGTTVRLHNRTGGTAENIIGWYPSELEVDGPGSLSDFVGESCLGEWELWVSDNAGIDLGVVNDWCVRATGAVQTGIDEGELGVPSRYVLGGVSPNPFNPVTKVSYGLPKDGPVSLRIYNVAGRLVRTLVDGPEEAGYHEATWDGRDDRGVEAASGVYFCRMEAEGFDSSAKMVLLK